MPPPPPPRSVVYNKTDDSETDIVLKGVVRVENLVSRGGLAGPTALGGSTCSAWGLCACCQRCSAVQSS